MTLVLFGCGKKDELALGKYEERKYVNETFKLEHEIPEDFSYLTPEELEMINAGILEQSPNPDVLQYRNLVLNVEHLDGAKLIAFVDAHPTSAKNKEAEANAYLDFLADQDVKFEFEKSEKEINGVNYLQIDLDLPFDQYQRNYITVRQNKLVNIQINYTDNNRESGEVLLSLYE